MHETDENESATGAAGDLWIFAYGSLMWRPGFPHAEMARARLVGFSRSFCVYSVHHRGNEKRPGLVLGLDRGGSCEGIAYRVAGDAAAETLAYLRAREQVNGVYREARVRVTLQEPGRPTVDAVAYIVERAHPSYAARLPLSVQADLIRGGRGLSGDNIGYLVSTARHLRILGIRERQLERLIVMVGGLVATAPAPAGERPCPRAAAMARRFAATRGKARGLKRGERRRFLHRLKLQRQ